MANTEQYWYSRTEVRSIANKIKKLLLSKESINEDSVYDIGKELGLNYDGDFMEDNLWRLDIQGSEGVRLQGSITRKALEAQHNGKEMVYYTGNRIEDGIYFEIDGDKKTISCLVYVYVMHKHIVYDDSTQFEIFSISY